MLDWSPEDRGRIAAAVIVTTGAIFTQDHVALVVLWGLALLILWGQGEIKVATQFLYRIWIPMACGLIIVWGFIVKGTPEEGTAVSIERGLEYAALISFRIAALAAVFQALFLSQSGFQRVRFWSRLGFPPSAVAVIVSIFELWPNFARQTEQIVGARCARGLMTDRKLITRLRQIPFTFRTLFLSSLESSMERAVRWQCELLPERLVEIASISRDHSGSLRGSLILLTLSLGWVIFAFR